MQYLYVSRSNVPSSNSFVSLDIGNNFTELIKGGRYVIPASGWLQVNVPSTALPDPGPAGVVFYSQTLKFRPLTPLPVSNLQSIQLVR